VAACLRDVRDPVEKPGLGPAHDPHGQLDDVGATPLAPTKLTNLVSELKRGR
jgi:hypothetical protein